jgi:DNA helicase-2/ATP-dependent DNA helicase PcrA
MIIVGDAIACYEFVLNSNNSADLKILARTNDTVNFLKYNLTIDPRVGDLLSKFENCDTNNHRRKTILRTIEGIELARSANFQRALKSIKKIFKDMEQDLIIPSSISYLKRALDDYQLYCDCTIYDFRDYIDSTLKVNTPRYSRGKAFVFTSDITYKQMAASISLEAEKSNFLTIHKAKGDEYDTVLLSLVREADLSFLISPELSYNEEHRIYYVAISRARRNLYINVPTLTEENSNKLGIMGFKIVRL